LCDRSGLLALARAAAERLAPEPETPNPYVLGGFFWSGGVLIRGLLGRSYNPKLRPSERVVNEAKRPVKIAVERPLRGQAPRVPGASESAIERGGTGLS